VRSPEAVQFATGIRVHGFSSRPGDWRGARMPVLNRAMQPHASIMDISDDR